MIKPKITHTKNLLKHTSISKNMHGVNDAETHLKFDTNIFNFRLEQWVYVLFLRFASNWTQSLLCACGTQYSHRKWPRQLELFNIYVKHFSLISIFIHFTSSLRPLAPLLLVNYRVRDLLFIVFAFIAFRDIFGSATISSRASVLSLQSYFACVFSPLQVKNMRWKEIIMKD